ncbi:MAG TPA: N-acetylmuramoyl-L-alanine amidase [Steroidobacteraceae bacterium]|nr:N-acetylmuramoyl-L-alanine amidase [Steroidobacteraceae bacterium]
MIRKAFLGGVVGGLLTLAALPTATAAELRSMQLSATGESVVLTLRLTGGPGAKVFTLDDPDRAVIDLPETRTGHGMRLPAAAGLVSAVRLGRQPGGTLRVVLELKSAAAVHSSQAAGASGRELTVTLGEPAAPVVDTGPKVVRAAHAPGDGDRDVIIAVDAGHGGVDPGALGHGGTREKDVTLAIARDLVARINTEPGMRAVLTRDRDEFLELRDRIQRAHAAHADMFVSIHADSIRDRSISGASVYILSVHGASSEAARELAEGQNAVDLMGGVLADAGAEAKPVVLDLAQQESIGLSATAAERVVSALERVGEVRKGQVQRAGFAVLKSPGIPSMLIETAYISNPAEERRLRSPDQQSRLADAICGGVRSYFVANPPDGTRFKQERRVASAAEVAAAGGGSTAALAPLSQ